MWGGVGFYLAIVIIQYAELVNNMVYKENIMKWNIKNKRSAELLRHEGKLILRISTPISAKGKLFHDLLDVTQYGEERITKAMEEWVSGKLVQEAFPFLSPDARDLILMPSFLNNNPYPQPRLRIKEE